jgi:putative DNA primase/helicase
MSEAEEERAANPLVGKRLVLAMEPSSGARLSEGLIKKWTGGDRLRARPLYSESFEFDPTHQLILCTNHKPTVSNQDDGVWGRLRLIPFNQKFEGKKKDPAISEKLREQYPGILRWLVEGATRYYEFGLSDVPKAIGEATDAYRAHEDICSQFVEECLDVTDPTASTPFQEVYATYNRWCVAHGRRPLSDRTWGGELDRVLGRGRVKKKTGMVCEGVKLRPNQGRGGFTDATDAALF